MPRTVAALLVLPLAVDQATATAPGQIDPNGAFLYSSQYLVVVLRRPLEFTHERSAVMVRRVNRCRKNVTGKMAGPVMGQP
jgi:hypothetical protein